MALKPRLSGHVFLVDKPTHPNEEICLEIGIYSNSIFQTPKKTLIIQQQEKYISKLAKLRETLKEESEKPNRFEENMQCFPKSRLTRDKQLEANPEEPSRKAHLERLRRIRMLQKRRKAPPLLTPIHGIQIFAPDKPKNLNQKTQHKAKEQIRQWSPENRIKKAVLHPNTTKSNKHQKVESQHDIYSECLQKEMNLPSDIRELLRRTRHSDPPVTSQSNHSPHHHQPINSAADNSIAANETTTWHATRDTPKSGEETAVVEDKYMQEEADFVKRTANVVSRPRDIAQASPLKNTSSSFGRTHKPKSKSSLGNPRLGKKERKLEYVSSQVVGYRLPPLYRSMPTTPADIASSPAYLTPMGSPRRQIVVKIPQDIKM